MAKNVRNHPDVLFYADSHEDFNSSARNVVSRWIMHRLFYRQHLQRALPMIRKILCISTESMDFVNQVYSAPREVLEFYPLGGFPISNGDRALLRQKTRQAQGWSDNAFDFLQPEKMTPRKMLADSLQTFRQLPDKNLRFVIVGLLSDTVRDKIEELVQGDSRISFLDWKSPDELTNLPSAAGVYIQPSTQSATMQHALCCGCTVIIDDVPAHRA